VIIVLGHLSENALFDYFGILFPNYLSVNKKNSGRRFGDGRCFFSQPQVSTQMERITPYG
jgi:hypothetical protein